MALEAKRAGRIDEAKELLMRARVDTNWSVHYNEATFQQLEADGGIVQPATQVSRPQAAVKPVQRRRSSSPAVSYATLNQERMRCAAKVVGRFTGDEITTNSRRSVA